MLNDLAFWADNAVTKVTYIPQNGGTQRVWQVSDGTLSDPSSGQPWATQKPINFVPSTICRGDKFLVEYWNGGGNSGNPNTFAMALKIDSVIYKTFDLTQNTVLGLNRIIVVPESGHLVVNPDNPLNGLSDYTPQPGANGMGVSQGSHNFIAVVPNSQNKTFTVECTPLF